MLKNNNNEHLNITPLEVKVENDNFEDACRKFKSLFQKERIIGRLKEKQFYEKPSDRKRRKRREAKERKLMLEMRERMIQNGEWEKRVKKRQQKKHKSPLQAQGDSSDE